MSSERASNKSGEKKVIPINIAKNAFKMFSFIRDIKLLRQSENKNSRTINQVSRPFIKNWIPDPEHGNLHRGLTAPWADVASSHDYDNCLWKKHGTPIWRLGSQKYPNNSVHYIMQRCI